MSTSQPGSDELSELASQELERLVRRLRSFSSAAWRSRRGVIEDLLDRLASIEQTLTSGQSHRLPHVEDHALADAVSVIGSDVLAASAGTADADLSEVVNAIRSASEATR